MLLWFKKLFFYKIIYNKNKTRKFILEIFNSLENIKEIYKIIIW